MGTLIRHGVAARCLPGERVSGDAYLVKTNSDRALLAVMDGLGHGEAASAAAQIAVATLHDHDAGDPATLLQYCHDALKGSRGVAMSLASINGHDNVLVWLGVGNVEGLLVQYACDPPRSERLVTRGGVVGYQLPPLHKACLPVTAGDLLIFASDGIRSDFASVGFLIDPLLKHRDVQQIADRILADFGKATDDALVLVVRYLGETR
ncbi:MAG: stage sporulation protein [Proteobacteria bacterium]|nr:stage sporulation protein [Pseudomonadota bacterium]